MTANNVGASAFSISNCRHHPAAATPKSVRSLSATVEFPVSLKNRLYCASSVWAGLGVVLASGGAGGRGWTLCIRRSYPTKTTVIKANITMRTTRCSFLNSSEIRKKPFIFRHNERDLSFQLRENLSAARDRNRTRHRRDLSAMDRNNYG